ncbi:MAG: hypothetical protein H0V82_02980 [Candidatus Protochlamydia sp.]|nr:hypothetical protein [Candidatus Protochlamydia sp.]
MNSLRSCFNDVINAIPFISPAIQGDICEASRSIQDSRMKPIVAMSAITALATTVLALLAADVWAGTTLAAAVSVLPGGLVALSIYAIFMISLGSVVFGLAKLDNGLTERAIDNLAITKFIESEQVPFDAAEWIIKRPHLVNALIEKTGLALSKPIERGYKNIFQMALCKANNEICELIWQKMTFLEKKEIFDLKGDAQSGWSLGIGLSKKDKIELNSRIQKFQKLGIQLEKNACNQFIFGVNAAADEHTLPRLPQEIKAFILNLRRESQEIDNSPSMA